MHKNNDNNQYIEYVKEHAEHAAEYTKNLISTAQSCSSEMVKKATDICAHNMALGKNFLNCSNFEDLVHWGEKFAKTNIEKSVEIAGSVFSKVCNDITEANGHVAKKISKNISNLKNKF